MSEILDNRPMPKEGVSQDETMDWEALTVDQSEPDWGSVAEAEFVGETVEMEEAETIENTVARLREWIDLDAIAQNEDPEGLAAVEQESETRRARVEQYKIELTQSNQRQAEIGQRREELPQELSAAKFELSRMMRQEGRGLLGGLKKALGVGATKRAELEATVTKLEAEQASLFQEMNQMEREQYEIERVIAETDIDGPRQEFLEQFETPLTPDEKQRGLKFEALAELSTEEYLQLWRRLNPFFVTHVTRQGIRDHNAMFYHSAGMGEFQDGMTGVLADGKILRTPAEVHYGLGREMTEQNVEEALGKMLYGETSVTDVEAMREQGMSDKEIAEVLVEKLPVNTTLATADPWADRQAVHFAQMIALDDYYGGESENEAFFVFPTDVVASQCRFGGHMHDNLITAQIGSETKWNDLFVWPQDQEMTIDAGLTFLPKSTLVDAETGSKYATREVEVDGRKVRVPEVDEVGVTKFVEWMQGLKPEDESVRLATSLDSRYDMEQLRAAALEAGVPERIINAVLKAENGFQYDLQTFVNGGELKTLWVVPPEELEKLSPEERRARSVREFLEGESATWKLAENAVSAEEYWERYFAEHPEQRPAHVIYYDGNPTQAVVSTLKQAGILEDTLRPYGLDSYSEWQRYTGRGDSHERDGGWLGFEKNLVRDDTTDEALQAQHRRFNEIARQKIAEHYDLKA